MGGGRFSLAGFAHQDHLSTSACGRWLTPTAWRRIGCLKGRSCSASRLRVLLRWTGTLEPFCDHPLQGRGVHSTVVPLTALAGVGTTIFYYCTACNFISILQWIVFTYFKIATCTSTGRLALRPGEARAPDVLGTTAAGMGPSNPWPELLLSGTRSQRSSGSRTVRGLAGMAALPSWE